MTIFPLLFDERVRPTGPFVSTWSLHPSVLIGTGLFAALYIYGITTWRRRSAPSERVNTWQVVSFGFGLLLLLGSLNGPIHDLSDYYLFSAHMLQHLLLTLVVPPLLLVGTPGWLLSRFFARPPILRTARFVTSPVVAGALYSLTIIFWHLVPMYDLMMRNHEVHIATHLMFIVMATIMWWPVLSPSPEVPRASPGVRMLYLFLVGIPMQIVAAPISLADNVLYTWYAAAPRTWGITALQDQQIGGLMMWVPAGLYLWGAIAIVFFVWTSKEK
ncbi:MAG: cytochrome c oxidase assembly protein [Gemmatimonadota bacterium]